jgi:mannose-6-phosphate isomerase-like protein (cupin superfamily)
MYPKRYLVSSSFFGLFIFFVAGVTALGFSGQEKETEEILARFVDSYRAKISAGEARIFGLQVQGEGGGEWHVLADPGKNVSLRPGKSPKPTYYFTLDLSTLRKIDRGEVNALTAMGKARASDQTSIDIQMMEGFAPSPQVLGEILSTTFHFFTLGSPEIIPFGEQYSRPVHGANMVIFYYEPGLRTAWAQIKKGMVVNKDVKDQVNPFPTIAVGIRGRAKVKLGENILTLEKGRALLIPAGISHQIWNEEDEPVECIIIMFGKNA